MKQLDTAIERIKSMEERFDMLLDAAKTDLNLINTDPVLAGKLSELIDYYVNGLWLRDYELDEKGLLPKELKRGILSEDGFYNLLSELSKI